MGSWPSSVHSSGSESIAKMSEDPDPEWGVSSTPPKYLRSS